MLRKERWAALTEVQFAELKAAEDLFKRGKWTAARNAYEKFMTVYPKADASIYCQLMMAESMMRSGKPNDAISDFQFVRDLAPDSDDARWAHFRIAQCHKAAGNFERAMAVLGEIWKDAGEHPTAFYAAAEQCAILEGQQKFKERVPIWQGVIERFSGKPVDPAFFSLAARSLAREKLVAMDIDGALEMIKLGGKQGRGGKSGDPELELLNMARAVIAELARTGDRNRVHEKLAAAFCGKAMEWIAANKDRPNHQQIIGDLISILVNVGKKDEAVKQALQARKLYGDARWTIEQAVKLFESFGQTDDAIRQASDARKVYSDADWTLALYASLVVGKDMELALAAWDKMKDRIQGFTLSSEALLKAGKTDDAIARRRKLSQIDPHLATAVFMWVGGVYEKHSKFDLAIKEYRQAQNEPTNLFLIAGCLCKQQKHKEAIAQLGEIAAVFADQNAPRAIYLMAMEYEHIDNSKQAINLLRRVCRTYPKAPSASLAHTRLESKYGIDETLGGSTGEKKED